MQPLLLYVTLTNRLVRLVCITVDELTLTIATIYVLFLTTRLPRNTPSPVLWSSLKASIDEEGIDWGRSQLEDKSVSHSVRCKLRWVN